MNLALSAHAACKHCGLVVPSGNSFCCAGCESVYSLLAERGFSHFYDLRDQYSFAKPMPVLSTKTDGTEYSAISSKESAQFYLEGIHCLGCLWLLEKLPELENRIERTKLDLTHQILEVNISEGRITWGEVVQLLASLGYSAKLIAEDQGKSFRKLDQQRQARRVALAGFCAGNIMLLAVSIYAGADPWWSRHFGWLSLALALPCLSYSAWPIYRSAFFPLRHGQLSADLAIALALLAGLAMSLWSLFQGTAEHIYFDSLTMLVFLLLSSRFLLSQFRESLAKESTCLSLISQESYRRTTPKAATISAEKIAVGDNISLRPSQTLPVDSTLMSNEAYFDLSLLTGESHPLKFLPGDTIDAGAKLLSDTVELRALRVARKSRLARILDQIEIFQLQRSPSLAFADRVGRFFVVVVLGLAAVTVLAAPTTEGLQRALALVIVTCPCVLAFAVPLTLTRALQISARKGIIFRSAEKLECLAAARSIFLDKTGTLTSGAFEVLRWHQIWGDPGETKSGVYAVESLSSHPVGKALGRFTEAYKGNNSATNFRELPGRGVQGESGGQTWKIIHLPAIASEGNQVGVYRDEVLVAEVVLGDAQRPEAFDTVKELKRLGFQVSLLSGDSEKSTRKIATRLGIRAWRSRMLPEDKAAEVAKEKGSIMVGDGANDAIAFQGATVGIAMQGAMELSLRHSDILLTRPGLSSLLDAIRLARSTMRIVRTNFAITLVYNIAACGLAISGRMSPLLAAIFMPSSALSVYALTQWQTRKGAL